MLSVGSRFFCNICNFVDILASMQIKPNWTIDTVTKNQNFLKVAITITFLIEIGLNLNSMYAHELMSCLIYNPVFFVCKICNFMDFWQMKGLKICQNFEILHVN
jgi:hypothetical protein